MSVSGRCVSGRGRYLHAETFYRWRPSGCRTLRKCLCGCCFRLENRCVTGQGNNARLSGEPLVIPLN